MEGIRLKKKHGFIATSLIYSFFLVFLMLMVSILARTANNRILLGAMKEDIKTELNSEAGFIIETIESKTYNFNERVTFANESWLVLKNNTNSVVVVLERSLTQDEVLVALGKNRNTSEFFGTCNVSSCQVRACRNFYAGQEFCYLYSGNTNLYTSPAWNPSMTQIQNQNYGKTIVSEVVNNWFFTHQGLRRAMQKEKLVSMTFSDGFMNNTGYIRLPLSNEVSGVQGVIPFHLSNSIGTSNGRQTRIYNGSVQTVWSYNPAYIRPVIEIKKGE